jgi:hypothetical protein
MGGCSAANGGAQPQLVDAVLGNGQPCQVSSIGHVLILIKARLNSLWWISHNIDEYVLFIVCYLGMAIHVSRASFKSRSFRDNAGSFSI